MNKESNQVKTIELIREVAFRHFLEKGYEAANLNKIASEVGIKTASLYFYYNSKKDLFLDIINRAITRQLEMLVEISQPKQQMVAMEKLHQIYIKCVEDGQNNCIEYRLILRNRLFPAEELCEEIKNIFLIWQEKELSILEPLIANSINAQDEESQKQIKMIYYQFKKSLYSVIYGVIISGVAVKKEEVEGQWTQFVATAFAIERIE